ncbi:MAG: hypothetical protein HKN34_00445 [Gammaproteobacteria bacterium]|nr:hypothetical protein [Gammaproteobacteria bacterium]
MSPGLNRKLPRCSLNSIGRIRRVRLLAVIPVLIAAIVNTGYQYYLVKFSSTEATLAGVFDIVLRGLIYIMPIFVVALLSAAVWERIFAEKRGRPFDTGVIYTAFLVTLLMPPNAGFIHIVFGMSFAMVFAHGIFGGEGKSFLNPALVAVAMIQITFPGSLPFDGLWRDLNGYAGIQYFQIYHQQGGLTDISWLQAFFGNTQGLMGTTSVFAISISAAWLIFHRMISWRLLCGHVIGLIIMAIICDYMLEEVFDVAWYWQPVLGSFAFAAVFLASDPSASASTNTGRWVQGILAGALIVLLRALNPSHGDSVIPVLLLVSMLAPLIDHIVVWFNIRRRVSGHA